MIPQGKFAPKGDVRGHEHCKHHAADDQRRPAARWGYPTCYGTSHQRGHDRHQKACPLHAQREVECVLGSGVVRQAQAKYAVDHRDDNHPREESGEAGENGTLHQAGVTPLVAFFKG